MVTRPKLVESLIWLALAAIGVGTRVLLSDLPNFAPVAALALFAGYFFTSRTWAALLPSVVMIGSDLVLGGYDCRLMLVVYGSLTLPVLFGVLLRDAARFETGRSAWTRTAGLIGSCLASSVLFFVVTNFAVWALSDWYASSWDGLVHCYARALPFFRYTLQGDLFFSVVLFGGYALATAAGWTPVPSRVAERG